MRKLKNVFVHSEWVPVMEVAMLWAEKHLAFFLFLNTEDGSYYTPDLSKYILQS